MPYCRPGKGSSQGADRSIAGCDGPCAKRYARVFPAPWRDLRSMSTSRAWLLTVLAMFAFAGNSLLCRAALQDTTIDAATFTSLRLAAGALTLWAIAQNRLGGYAALGSWASALSLFVYAAGFSFAYRGLSAGVGALLLFGAVQATMIGYGLFRGERLHAGQWLGLLLAVGGLVGLLLPGLSRPPLIASALMLSAGVAWGIYTLRGRGAGDPTQVTAGNFVRAVPLGLALLIGVWLFAERPPVWDLAGVVLALTSGALTSGIGYAIWYAALPALRAATAATVQLSVPVITSLGGVLLLGEGLSLRLLLASVAILGGIALVIRVKR